MQAKTGKEALKEKQYIDIVNQRKEYAGEDCFTIVVGNEVIPIGYECQYSTCLDFLRDEIKDHPRRLVAKGSFKDLLDAYSYLLENCDDEYELRDFLSDYYEGMDMNEYDKR